MEVAAGEAARLGRLPEGLELNAARFGNHWIAENNRTLKAAQLANLPNVNPIDKGNETYNEIQKRLNRNPGTPCAP